MTNSKLLWASIIVVGLLAIGAYYYPSASQVVQQAAQQFGGVTNYDELDSTAIKVGGANGSRVGPIIAGTCNLIGTGGTFAASTTLGFDCAVTGVVSGDTVFAMASTSGQGQSLQGGWVIIGASASSTSGFIRFTVVNFTGATVAIPLALASSTQYLVLHPLSSVPGL